MEASATTPSSSSDVNVADAQAHIRTLGSTEEVLTFIGDDDRKGVTEAADSRLTELSAPSAPPVLTLASGEPPAEAAAGKPLEKGGSGTAMIRTRFPLDRFDHGIDGVPSITSAGVEVERSKVPDLLEAAKTAATPLEEVV